MLRIVLAFLAMVAALATTSPAFAMAGGGGKNGGGGSAAVSYNASQSADGKEGTFSGNFNGPDGNGNFSGTYTLSVTEPLVGVFVGLGLLGARYLRRR